MVVYRPVFFYAVSITYTGVGSFAACQYTRSRRKWICLEVL